jgi:hypothetical protein
MRDRVDGEVPRIRVLEYLKKGRVMIHYTCDRCKREIDPEQELRYVVKLEIQAAMQEKLEITLDDNHSAYAELHEAVTASYTAMFDRSRVDMRFTSAGLVIDSKISFK